MTQTVYSAGIEETVLADLSREVANALALYLNYKKYHWQVSGPFFRDLHLLFDEHATQVLAGVDELGERIRIKGGLAPHHPDRISKLAAVRFSSEGNQTPKEMVLEALDNHNRVVADMRAAIETAAKAGDPGTADLLTRLIQMHEKQAWFLREVAQRDTSLL